MGATNSTGLSPEAKAQVTLPAKQVKAYIKHFKGQADPKTKTINRRSFACFFHGLLDYKLRSQFGEDPDFLFDTFDVDHDVRLDEILLGLSIEVDGSEEDKAKLAFKSLDLDDSGTLSAEEIKKMFERFSTNVNQILKAEVELEFYLQMRKHVSQDVIEPYVKSQTKTVLEMIEEKGMQTVFRIGDKDEDKTISLDEWLTLVKEYDIAKFLVSPKLYADKIRDVVVEWCLNNIDL